MSIEQELPIKHEDEGTAENILHILSNLNKQIEQLKFTNESYLNQLNAFRLGFHVPLLKHEIDINPIATQIMYSLSTFSLDQMHLYGKLFTELAARNMDLVEQKRSKEKVQVDLGEKDQKATKDVAVRRGEKQAKIILTSAEKAIRGIMRSVSGKSQMPKSALIPIIHALHPALSETEIESLLDSIALKAAKSGKGKN